jgi:ABC-type antimicrobial peptide transport system permease subunit
VESGASSRAAFVLRLSQPHSSAEQGLYRVAQQQIWSLDRDLPAYETTSLASLVSESVAQRRFTTLLMGGFAITALLLATVGLFGVISYVVSERKRELAVRIALGARKSNIGWIILGKASSMATTGCVIGLLVYVAAARLLRSSLFAISVFDPATLVFAPLILAGVALLAAYWPARRAMRSDPMVALRYE